MTTAIAEKTVREIAVETPESIRVFESLGIDYCCGGRRPLSEACARAHVEVEDVLRMLDRAGQEAPVSSGAEWRDRPLTELIQHIVGAHHAYVRRETPRLISLLARVCGKHANAYPELIRIEELFTVLGQELASHMLKEEQVLFPYIGNPTDQTCFGSVRNPISHMMAEHDDAGALLARIRELSGNFLPPAGACPSFIALYRGLEEFERDLHRHIHLENNILFPRAMAL